MIKRNILWTVVHLVLISSRVRSNNEGAQNRFKAYISSSSSRFPTDKLILTPNYVLSVSSHTWQIYSVSLELLLRCKNSFKIKSFSSRYDLNFNLDKEVKVNRRRRSSMICFSSEADSATCIWERWQQKGFFLKRDNTPHLSVWEARPVTHKSLLPSPWRLTTGRSSGSCSSGECCQTTSFGIRCLF